MNGHWYGLVGHTKQLPIQYVLVYTGIVVVWCKAKITHKNRMLIIFDIPDWVDLFYYKTNFDKLKSKLAIFSAIILDMLE
jgi:hypothetical protein